MKDRIDPDDAWRVALAAAGIQPSDDDADAVRAAVDVVADKVRSVRSAHRRLGDPATVFRSAPTARRSAAGAGGGEDLGTIRRVGAALRRGDTSSRQLTEAALAAAEDRDHELGVYLTRLDADALDAADRADELLGRGEDLGPLHGIPIGVKDVIDVAGVTTTGQSMVRVNDDPPSADAPVVARLRAAGAVVVGKTSTFEFATGMFDSDKPFPIPRNAWDTSRFPGGSSSGSAVGVAAGFFLAGLGTDTGGSVRAPASFNGITGLMPTFGLVPKTGVLPVGFSLDTVGPIALSVADCAVLLETMAGHDAGDACSVDVDGGGYVDALGRDVDGVRVGIDRVHHGNVDPTVAAAMDAVVEVFDRLGATVTDVSIPLYDELTHATMVVSRSEAAAYHLPDLQERWSDYGRPARTGLAWGVMFSGADYVQAQRVRRLGQERIADVFDDVDVVISPTVAGGAHVMADLAQGANATAHFTLVWNALGLPAVSVPMGFDDDGMPLGLQIAGPAFSEALLIRVGDAFQRHTDWHRATPPNAYRPPVR